MSAFAFQIWIQSHERESICLADCVCERGLAKFRARLEILLGLDRLCVSFGTERFGWD